MLDLPPGYRHEYSARDVQALDEAAEILLSDLPPDTDYGVCYALTMHYGVDAYPLVEAAAMDWEHSKRNSDGLPLSYFVPEITGFGPWEGSNLEMRKTC